MQTLGLYGLGLLLLVGGVTLWKLSMARKLTPWLLLAAACTLMGTAVYHFLGDKLTDLAKWASKLTSKWLSVGAPVLLLALALWFLIYLVNGLHPKKGKFKKGHNWAALLAPVAFVAAGGSFEAAILGIQQFLQDSGVTQFLS